MIYVQVVLDEVDGADSLKFHNLEEAVAYIKSIECEHYFISNFFDKTQTHVKEEEFVLVELCSDCNTLHREDDLSLGKSKQTINQMAELNMLDEAKIVNLSDFKKKWAMN